MFKHPLNDSTSIWMSCEVVYLTVESINDELNVFGRDPLDGFLNDMIAVLVFDTL